MGVSLRHLPEATQGSINPLRILAKRKIFFQLDWTRVELQPTGAARLKLVANGEWLMKAVGPPPVASMLKSS